MLFFFVRALQIIGICNFVSVSLTVTTGSITFLIQWLNNSCYIHTHTHTHLRSVSAACPLHKQTIKAVRQQCYNCKRFFVTCNKGAIFCCILTFQTCFFQAYSIKNINKSKICRDNPNWAVLLQCNELFFIVVFQSRGAEIFEEIQGDRKSFRSLVTVANAEVVCDRL